MLEKKTTIDKIEIALRTGLIHIRFKLAILEDGQEISSSWHRTCVEPGTDVDKQIAAVNADISVRPGLKAAPIEASDVPALKNIVKAIHTKEKIDEFRGSIGRPPKG